MSHNVETDRTNVHCPWSFIPSKQYRLWDDRKGKSEKPLFVPRHWFDVIKAAKIKKPCFEVHPMRRENF